MRVGKPQTLRQGMLGFSSAVTVTLMLFIFATSGIAWVCTGMIAQERWPIRWLEIDGQFERVSAERLRVSLEPLVKGSFFMVDTGLMRETATGMPWVSDVAIQKSWPDTVQVNIQEFTPVTHWIDGYLLDADGQRFSVPSADDIQGLPWLEGPETQLFLIFENWKRFDEKLGLIGQRIERLSLDPRGSWSARLSGGTEVRLGKDDVIRNLDMLISTWAGLMLGQPVAPVRVDLRYTNGFAVLWPQETKITVGTYGEKS